MRRSVQPESDLEMEWLEATDEVWVFGETISGYGGGDQESMS